MSPANNSGANGDSRKSPDWVGAPIVDEVTRVEAVRHHAGVVGHGAFILVFLAATAVFVSRSMVETALLTVGLAYAVALNGVTGYFWDRTRAYLDAVLGNGQEETSGIQVPSGVSTRVDYLAQTRNDVSPRTMASSRFSKQDKVELLAVFALGTGVLVTFGVGVAVLQAVSLETAVYLFSAVLLAGLLGTVAWTYRHRRREETTR